MGENRAEYGREIIKKLSKELTGIYGKGFNKTTYMDICSFIRFSRQCRENPNYCLGHIMYYCCQYQMRQHVTDMPTRLSLRLGACGHFVATSAPNITIVFCSR